MLTAYKLPIIMLLALVCAFIVTQTLICFGFIYGDSMEPTYKDGDTVIVDRTLAAKRDLKRGDVIIFNNEKVSKHPIVKRVAALPGDTVEIKDGTLYINDEANDSFDLTCDDDMAAFTVPKNSLFVLGDNPSASKDSRHEDFGFVAKSSVIGRVICADLFP
jgi:signal peptidase I